MWNLDESGSIYLQICQKIKTDLVKGLLKSGDKVPSVREYAAEAGVNPNTMQRALSILEGEGLLKSERTSGRFVSASDDEILKLKQAFVSDLAEDLLKSLNDLGIEKADFIKRLNA